MIHLLHSSTIVEVEHKFQCERCVQELEKKSPRNHKARQSLIYLQRALESFWDNSPHHSNYKMAIPLYLLLSVFEANSKVWMLWKSGRRSGPYADIICCIGAWYKICTSTWSQEICKESQGAFGGTFLLAICMHTACLSRHFELKEWSIFLNHNVFKYFTRYQCTISF